MAIELTMPKLGLTMDEGTINSWLKKEGDYIEAGKTLLTVETDKVTIDVESPVSGTLLKILVKEGETVPVSQPIGYIGQPGEILPDAKVQEKVPPQHTPEFTKPVEITTSIPGSGTERPVSISPIARKLAAENKIDFSDVQGTGPGGRIIEEDIQKLIKANDSEDKNKHYRAEKISPLKRITAQRMAESFRETPHFYLQKQLNVDKLVAIKEKLISDTKQSNSFHVTYTDFLLKNLALTLQSHPYLNASWVEDNIHLFQAINLGFAVASPKGLVVAVIKDAQIKSLSDIAMERSDLSKKAKENLLSQDDVSGGTFTLTNLGMYGIDNFLPIINPPQSAILAVGAISEKPVVYDHQIGIHQMLDVTLAADHRVVDGAQAAEFLVSFTEILTNWPDKLFA